MVGGIRSRPAEAVCVVYMISVRNDDDARGEPHVTDYAGPSFSDIADKSAGERYKKS